MPLGVLSVAGLGSYSPGRSALAILAYPELVEVLERFSGDASGAHAGAVSGTSRAMVDGSPRLGLASSGLLGVAAATHVQARQWFLDGWALAHPGQPPPPLGALQFYQALGALEGGPYGLGWTDKPSPVTGLQTSMAGSWNMGGIQCTNCPPQDGVCCDGCGYWYDSRPTADGQKYFEQCFRRYPSPAAGAAAVIAFLDHYPKVLAALPSNDLDEIAYQMRLGGYYRGFSTDKKVAAATYAKGLSRYVGEIAQALGEPRVMTRQGGQTVQIDCGSECAPPAQDAGASGDGSDSGPPVIGSWTWGDLALAAGAAVATGAALSYAGPALGLWRASNPSRPRGPGHAGRLPNPSPPPGRGPAPAARAPRGSRVLALGDRITLFCGSEKIVLPPSLWIVVDQGDSVWGRCSVALVPPVIVEGGRKSGQMCEGEMLVPVAGHISGEAVPRTPLYVALTKARGPRVGGRITRIWYTRYDRPLPGMDHAFKGPAFLYRAGRGYRLELPAGCVVSSLGFVNPLRLPGPLSLPLSLSR